jgi:hypothetical protein
MKRVIAVSLALVMVLSALALANGVGAFSAFKSGIGARALGMGGAFVAVADDATAVMWNPAGLAQIADTRIAGMTTDLYGLGVAHQYVGAVTTFANLGIGLAWERGGVSSGTEELTDEDGDPILPIELQESKIVGTLATNIMDIALAGVNLKYYMANIGGANSATGIGFDLGVLVNLGDIFVLGVNAADLGSTKVTWESGAADMVSGLYKAGVAMKLVDGKLILAADMDFVGTDLGDAHLGIEFQIVDALALRAGVVLTDAFQNAVFGVGAGINVAGLYIDAAYILEGALGNTLLLSAEFSLGDLLGTEEVVGVE